VAPLVAADRAIGFVRFQRDPESPFSSADARLAQLAAHRTALAVDHTVLAQRLQRATVRARSAEAQLALLIEAGRAMAGTTKWQAAVEVLADRVVRHFADYCAVYRLDTLSQCIDRVVVRYRDHRLDMTAHQTETRVQLRPDAVDVVSRVVRSGVVCFERRVAPARWREIAIDGLHLRLLQAMRLRSLIVVPITAGRAVRGALSLGLGEHDRCFSYMDVATAEHIAGLANVAHNLVGPDMSEDLQDRSTRNTRNSASCEAKLYCAEAERHPDRRAHLGERR
jgi:GAF domain-containing protein